MVELLLTASMAFQLSPATAQCPDCEYEAVLEAVFEVGDYPLATVSQLVVLPDSSLLFALQPEVGEVARFNTESRTFLDFFGRQGDGPGELRLPVRMAWNPRGLWVADAQQRRLSYFSSDGSYLDSSQYPAPPQPYQTGSPIVVDAEAWVFEGMLPRGSFDARGDQVSPLLRQNLSTGVADTLTWLSRTNTVMFISTSGARAGTFALRQRFGDYDLWGGSPTEPRIVVLNRRVVEGPGASFELRSFHAREGLEWERRFDFRPAALSEDDVRDYVAELAGSAIERVPGAFESPAEAETAIRDAAFTPSRWPVADVIVLSNDGEIWLRRAGAGGSGVWLVVDRAGTALRRAFVPAYVTVHAIVGERLWGTWEDELLGARIAEFRLVARP